MAEFAMWGPEQAGERLAAFDNSKLQLEGLKALQMAGEIQQQPIDAELKSQHARLYGAQADKALRDAKKEERFAEIVSRAGAGGDAQEHPAAQLERAGIAALSSGMVTEGRQLINTASQLRNRESLNNMNADRAARYRSLTSKDHATRLANLFDTVRDQASFERAILQAAGEGIDIENIPLDYEKAAPLVAQLRDASVGYAQRARLALEERRTAAAERNATSREEAIGVRRTYTQTLERLANARRDRIEREQGTSGGTVQSPTKADTKEAEALLTQDKIDLPKEEKTLAARSIASRAKALVKQNRGLDISQAMRMALEEAKRNGDLEHVPSVWDSIPGAKGNYKFKAKDDAGKTPEKAIPVPKLGDGKPDTSKLQDGNYYVIPPNPQKGTKGGVYKRVPGGWEQSSLSDISHLAALGLGDDDDDDDEALA